MKEIEREQSSQLKIEKFMMDNGVACETFLPEDTRDRIVFTNEHCEFKPIGFVRADFGWMPLAYKVVTDNMQSLGLRRNPTPMKFFVGQWVFEENVLEYGSKDFGGIWSAHRLGNANTLKKYCLQEKNMATKTYLCAVYNPVAFVGNYRIKSEGVMLMKEIV